MKYFRFISLVLLNTYFNQTATVSVAGRGSKQLLGKLEGRYRRGIDSLLPEDALLGGKLPSDFSKATKATGHPYLSDAIEYVNPATSLQLQVTVKELKQLLGKLEGRYRRGVDSLLPVDALLGGKLLSDFSKAAGHPSLFDTKKYIDAATELQFQVAGKELQQLLGKVKGRNRRGIDSLLPVDVLLGDKVPSDFSKATGHPYLSDAIEHMDAATLLQLLGKLKEEYVAKAGREDAEHVRSSFDRLTATLEALSSGAKRSGAAETLDLLSEEQPEDESIAYGGDYYDVYSGEDTDPSLLELQSWTRKLNNGYRDTESN